MEKKSKKSIVIGISVLLLVTLTLLGLTYAYYRTRVIGNESESSISVTSKKLEIAYGDGDGSILTSSSAIEPSDEPIGKKTFTVTNNGDEALSEYAVILEDLKIYYANDDVLEDGTQVKKDMPTYLEYPETMQLSITCSEYDKEEYEENSETAQSTGTCNGYESAMPSTNAVLLTNDIGVGVVQVYEMTLTYEDAEYDQSLDMNKTLEGKINIIDTSVTADIKGKLTNYEAGDYVQINSEPKKAYVDKDGKYKLIGVKAGSHTIGVYNTSNPTTAKSSTTINIEKGNSASVNNNTVTVDNLKRVIAVDIDASAKTYDISSTVDAISAVYLVNVGDYVEYTYTPGTYTVLASETGANGDQTFESAAGKRSAISAWRVLSTKNGIVTLISEKPTVQNLVLDGTKGYLNGPYILNEMTEELYSSENGTARSINLEDIKVIVEKYPTQAEVQPAYRYRDINGQLITFEYGMTIGEAETAEGKTLTNIITPDGSDYKTLDINYYSTDFTRQNMTEELETLFVPTVHDSASENASCLVATAMSYPDFSVDGGLIRYGLETLNTRRVQGSALYYSNGQTAFDKDGEYKGYGLRPVVQLKADLLVEWNETARDGAGAWTIKN